MPTIAALFWFAVLCWTALGLGGLVQRTLKIEASNPLKDLYIRLPIGLAILSFGTTLTGYMHLWNAKGAKLVFLALALLMIPVNLTFISETRSRARERKHYGFEPTVLIMGIAAMWILLGMNSLAPIINFDAERYHYLMPKLFLEHGSFFDYAPNPFPSYPMSIEMLFLGGFALAGQQVASLIDWLLGLMALIAWVEYLSRRLDETTALIAGTIFSSIAFITALVGGGYIDMSVSAFMLLGLIFIFEWYSERKKHDLIIAAIFLGTAIAGKYYALLWLLFITVSTLWVLIKTYNRPRVEPLKAIGIAALIIVVIALPWYGRNLAKYGNPVHPFLHTALTGEHLLDDDITRWSGSKAHPKTFGNFFKYLGELTFLGRQGGRLSTSYFQPLLVLFPLFGLFALKKPLVRWCLIYSLAFLVFAFLLMPYQTRYFIAFEMLMATCVAAGMKVLSIKRPILIFFMIVALIPLLIELEDSREEFAVRRDVILGQVPTMQYLMDEDYGFQVYNYANTELSRDSKILYMRERTFYLEAPYTVIEPSLNFDDARDPEEMLAKLRSMGYTHVMVEFDMLSTLNVLDAILDELPYNGSGEVVGEGDLRYVEFDYWPLVYSVHKDREMMARVLPAVIDVFGGKLIYPPPDMENPPAKSERYRLDLSPLRDKPYLCAYASLASELMPWLENDVVGIGWFADDIRLFDIREPDRREKDNDAFE